MNLQLTDFQRPDITDAAVTVLANRAVAEVMRERIDAIERQLLTEYELYTDPEMNPDNPNTRITEPNDTWLAGMAAIPAYCAARTAAITAAGYDTTGDTCPALVAEHKVTLSEHALIERVATIPGMEAITVNALLCEGIDTYREFIRMTAALATSALNR